MTETVGPAEDFEIAPEWTISDLQTLRVIADPLRMQILQVALEQPRTVKQMAAMLGVPVAKLYYHVNVLEEHQLLRVAGTRVVSGIIEKQYRVTVMRLRFDRSLLESGERDEALHLLLSTVLDTTREDIENISRAAAGGLIDFSKDALPERKLLIVESIARLSPPQVADFQRRLRDLLNEFGDDAHECRADPAYGLTILMHPLRLSLPEDDPDPAAPPG